MSRSAFGALLLAATACRIGFDHLPATDATDASDTLDAAIGACPLHPCSEPGIYRSVGPGMARLLPRASEPRCTNS